MLTEPLARNSPGQASGCTHARASEREGAAQMRTAEMAHLGRKAKFASSNDQASKAATSTTLTCADNAAFASACRVKFA